MSSIRVSYIYSSCLPFIKVSFLYSSFKAFNQVSYFLFEFYTFLESCILYWSCVPFIRVFFLIFEFHTIFKVFAFYSSFVTFKFGSRKQYSMESYKKYIRAFQNKYNFISLRRSILAQFHPDTLRIVQAFCDILATVPKF